MSWPTKVLFIQTAIQSVNSSEHSELSSSSRNQIESFEKDVEFGCLAKPCADLKLPTVLRQALGRVIGMWTSNWL